MGNYRETLIQTVIDNSLSKDWNNAVYEWEIEDCIEDRHSKAECICGKENIKYLFTIRNVENGRRLWYIGSTCIKKFNREELNEQIDVNEKLFKLLHKIKEGEFVSLNSEFFSRKLLKYLYDEGVFKDNQYNDFNGENDYNFLLRMFNKRKIITDNQKRKINAILVTSIKPYLNQKLDNKIK